MSTHQARKRFGQHFLISDDIIGQIVAAVAPQNDQTIVEIGPGRGAITDSLARQAGQFHAIEFDRDLVPVLSRRYQDNDRVTIHEADALQFDFRQIGDQLRIVGNLPYNISTPLLFHLLNFKDTISDMHFMLQKEVVERMAAGPGSKRYGRLTIMLGCQIDVVKLFDVPPDAFSPPPRVTSSVVRLRPKPSPAIGIVSPEVLESLVKQAFSRRRKTLRNALQGMADDACLQGLHLDPVMRPEQVPIEKWVALANTIANITSSDAGAEN